METDTPLTTSDDAKCVDIQLRVETIQILTDAYQSLEQTLWRFRTLKLQKNQSDTTASSRRNWKLPSRINSKKGNSRSDGFISPQKVAKKQKILQNYTLGATAPVNISNKLQSIAGSAALPTQDDTAVPVVRPKIAPIHLKFTKNYNLILQEIARIFPKSSSKYSGEYLKIFTSSPDEHRELTKFLQEKGEQYFALEPVTKRPQKVVMKGLPIETDIEEIKKDLTDRGFSVIKEPN
ncbi:nucleic-acid-binding protein from transposon X-element [Trichonephila inaurata madagascariensis]|uniref:Nucleic-acid-binding protein from transposon X-element n=1 Tax=Trichonephila inaurata madagascariensis TaxID=2747483 RepID=A0A8X6YRQ5_9ARAC|nr:nucleic-acid-binding protein from transposon X-element [Trichonephila inaurata madagascariensis]